MKKAFITLFFVVCFCMAISIVHGAAQTVVTVGEASAECGDIVNVDIKLSGNKGFSSLGIEIDYDKTALELTGATSSGVGATFTKAQSLNTVPYNMGWSSPENNTFNGTIATLTFRVLTDIAGDYKLKVSYFKGRNGNYEDGYDVNYDENYDALNLVYVDGKITVVGENIVEPVVPEIVSCGYKVDGANIIVNATLSAADVTGGKIIAAVYDMYDNMVQSRICDADADISIILESQPKPNSYVQLYWWYDMTDIMPVCESAICYIK